MNIINYLFRLILTALFPAFLIFAAKTNSITDFFIKNKILINEENLSAYQFWFFFIGTIIISLIVPVNLFFAERKLKKHSSILGVIVKMCLEKICYDLAIQQNGLNIRLFKVKSHLFSKSIKLVNHHIDGITVKINGNELLEFKVSKDTTEGVVGQSYNKKNFFVDYNITETNSYDLNEELKLRVGNVKFCCAAPIFKSKKIKYIISLDSDVKIHKSKEKNACLHNNLVYLCQTFDEFIL